MSPEDKARLAKIRDWATRVDGYERFLLRLLDEALAERQQSVLDERARCAAAVANMKNQRAAYREIVGDLKAQLPKPVGLHWADPFFAEAERALVRDGKEGGSDSSTRPRKMEE